MPAAGNETMYSNNTNPTASIIGGLAVGVPGEIRGWEMLHKRHGKLPWNVLFQPAINLARNGFIVNAGLATRLVGEAFPNTVETFGETPLFIRQPLSIPQERPSMG
jgi:gamma-glutamyltranspeptidase / glutathione hydrolase